MSAMVSIEIPREVLHATHMTTEDLKRELALHLYERGRLSFGKARELATMGPGDFQLLLGSRGIPVHYDAAEYVEDLHTLTTLGLI